MHPQKKIHFGGPGSPGGVYYPAPPPQGSWLQSTRQGGWDPPLDLPQKNSTLENPKPFPLPYTKGRHLGTSAPRTPRGRRVGGTGPVPTNRSAVARLAPGAAVAVTVRPSPFDAPGPPAAAAGVWVPWVPVVWDPGAEPWCIRWGRTATMPTLSTHQTDLDHFKEKGLGFNSFV